MKRARKKTPGNIKNHEYNYESDINELDYDPQTFAENEKDSAARPIPDGDGEDYQDKESTINLTDELDNIEKADDIENAGSGHFNGGGIPPVDGESGGDFEPYDEDDDYYYAKIEKRTKQMSPKNKKLLIFSISLVTILLLFFVSLGFGGFFSGSNPNENDIEQDYVEPVEKGTGKINVLILGVDEEGLRTDTIIVACYDLDDNKIDLLSIPRDTRMLIGSRYQKINAAHAISQNGKIRGPQGSIEAVTRLTGIPINYYVEFSFDAFKNTIDALGGVDFYVPRRMKYSDPTQDLYIDLEEGQQHLDGNKAEQLVRFRQYTDGDIDRVKMQQSFIQAVAEQKLNLGIITKIPDLYNVLKDDIDTNFKISDITKYINNLKDLKVEDIRMFQLPGQFSGPEYDASYWLPDMDAIKYMVEVEFNHDLPADYSPSASVSSDNESNKDSTNKPSSSSHAISSPTQKSTTTDKSQTRKPSNTKKPSAASTRTHTPDTPVPTKQPTQKPAEMTEPPKTEVPSTPKPTQPSTQAPTEAPVKTKEPTKAPTERPARPTPNVTAESEE